MKKRTWTAETICFWIGIAGIIAAAGTAAMIRLTPVHLIGHLPPCFLYTYLKIPCPGCGGTRALEALLEGNLLESFLAHPLVLYGAAAYLYYLAVYALVTFVWKKDFAFRQLPFGRAILMGSAVLLAVQWGCKLIFW